MIMIDSEYKVLPDKVRGRKPKIKFIKNGQVYFFKYGATNYEIFAELIAEQLGRQANIDMANYKVADYNGTIGLLSPSFLKPDELAIVSDKLKIAVSTVCDDNNIITDLKSNTITSLVQAAGIYDLSLDSEKVTYELMRRWVFYGLIMESDKNATNITFIKGINNKLTISPDYDNSTMARLNENVDNLVSFLRTGTDIYSLTDYIKTDLKISPDDSGNFLEDYSKFVKKYPSQANKILRDMNKIDLYQAIEEVEQNNNITIPWEVSFWLNKAISTRLEDLNNIYNNSNTKKFK